MISIADDSASKTDRRIDKYRSEKKPLFRRYAEKLKFGSSSPSLKAEKRSLPPGTFKQKGIFGGGIEGELPNNRNLPLAETTPYLPQELEKEKPWIDSSRFKAKEDTRSRFEGAEEEKEKETETILDFDNLSAAIVEQNIGDSSLLENGILPSEEELEAMENQEDEDSLFSDPSESEDAEGYNPFDRDEENATNDGVTPFRPALSPNIASKREGLSSSGDKEENIDGATPNHSTEAESSRINNPLEEPFESAIEDRRMVVGELEDDESKDSDLNEAFSQSNEIIHGLVSPHVKAFESEQEKRTRGPTEELLSKYSHEPDLSFLPNEKKDKDNDLNNREKSRASSLLTGQQQDALQPDNLLSNPAVRFPTLQSPTDYRPTSDVDTASLDGMNLRSLNNASTTPRPNNGIFNNGNTIGTVRSPNGPSFNANPFNASGNRLFNGQQPRIGSSGFRPDSTPSRFESPLRPRETQPRFGSLNSRNNPQQSSAIDLMRQSRDQNRVRSTFGTKNSGFPFGNR